MELPGEPKNPAMYHMAMRKFCYEGKFAADYIFIISPYFAVLTKNLRIFIDGRLH